MELGSGIRDPGSEIREPGFEIRKKPIPDPGVKKAPDPTYVVEPAMRAEEPKLICLPAGFRIRIRMDLH